MIYKTMVFQKSQVNLHWQKSKFEHHYPVNHPHKPSIDRFHLPEAIQTQSHRN